MFDVEQPRMMYGPIIDGWAALGDGDEAAKWLSQAKAEGLGKNKDSQKKVHTFEMFLGRKKPFQKNVEQMWSKCGRSNMAGIELNMILYNALSSVNCTWCGQKPTFFHALLVKEGVMFLKHTHPHIESHSMTP